MRRLRTLFLAVAALASASAEMCPGMCTCKWKSGKQAVECTNRGLITVPETIDVETQVLDMSGNNLQTLPKETFLKLGLVNLQKVYLRSCQLGQIDELAFRGLTNLIELDLSRNLLTSIPSGTFKDTPFLRDLVISDNPIQKIEGRSFHAVHGLVKLDLSNCQIQSVAPRAFEGIDMLESLKLNGNRLTELRLRTVENLTRLHGVELHGNPWHCDCRIRALKEWLIKHNIPYSEAPKCAGGPERVIDKSFAELHLDDFACRPEILPTIRYLEVVAGDNATVVCRTNAVPPAHVKWFWNGKQLANNTSSSPLGQKLQVFEEGSGPERKSTLVVDEVRESDTFEFYCVAENRAGSAEANFSVRVHVRRPLDITSSGHIAGLGAALILLVLIALVFVSILLARLRRTPTKTHRDGNEDGIAKPTEDTSNATSPGSKLHPTTEMNFCNPVRKPPRITTAGEVSGYLNGSVFPCVSPTNPDLINDTRTESGELQHSASGEYVRNVDSSLYPSGVWENAVSDRTPIIQENLGSQDELGYRNQLAGYPPDYGLPIQENQKTLRVWQKGAVPVLPPVTALKRALGGHNRSSPDEGYQEGCGTDV